MKIVTPPAISNLETLLEVAMNPEKLTTALKQMAEMKQAVDSQLDIYTTKQKADEYLAESQAMRNEAQNRQTETIRKVEETEAWIKAKLDQLTKDQDAWTKAKELEQAALRKRIDELSDQAADLRKAEVDLTEREITLKQRTTELDRLSAKLTAELEKMEQRKALLNAV